MLQWQEIFLICKYYFEDIQKLAKSKQTAEEDHFLYSPGKCAESGVGTCLSAKNSPLSQGPIANSGTGRLMGLPHEAFMEQ